MATARDLINNKRVTRTLSISPESSVLDATKLMAENNVGALLIETVIDQVQGILTERDIILKVDAKNLDRSQVSVSEIMTAKVLYVESHQSVEECMELMNSMGIRHLPVYEKGKLLGLVSVRDVLRTVISEQKTMIAHLENYISGMN